MELTEPKDSSEWGKVYMVPALIGDTAPLEVLPMTARKVIDMTNHFVVESEKSARAFIKKVHPHKAQNQIHIQVLNKYTEPQEVAQFINPCLDGHHVAMISEAGAPGIADPGADLVQLAHRKGIRVVPLVGPSSIQLALMASGLNGQNFAFTGYLPIDKNERKKQIKNLEKQSKKMEQSQIFMETPYRNHKLLTELLKTCHPDTQLCIARQITTPQEYIKTQSIAQWQEQQGLDLEKKPAIFILQA